MGTPHTHDTHESTPTEEARAKVARVFRYLLEMHRIKSPPTVHRDDYEWSLDLSTVVHHPGVTRGEPDGESGIVLEVGRPEESECPRPSVVFEKWLRGKWDDPAKEPTVHRKRSLDSGTGAVEESFEDSEPRVEAFEAWLEAWRTWASVERGVGDALDLFSQLFELSGRFARESEKFQLYLADGILRAESSGGEICHPLLLTRIELEFDASTPKFILRETGDPTEVYAPLLRHLGCEGKELLGLTEQVRAFAPHPLERTRTTQFLKDLVQRFWEDGQFIEHADLATVAPGPTVHRRPTILLGHRNHGFAESLERFIDTLPTTDSIPESLLRIVGIPPEEKADSAPSVVDPLLTKEANPEQERVIQRLAETGAVLVQGPPGTGKSHTIANLIGHLLAQNKTILVTSHASKALRVVREKVAEPLQSLCVSLLDSDEESARQLEESISGIVNALSTAHPELLAGEIETLRQAREELRAEETEVRRALLTAIAEEYRPIECRVVNGSGEGEAETESAPPLEVARSLAEHAARDGWIPAPVEPGAAPPLTEEEASELYALHAKITPEDIALAAEELPDPTCLPEPTEFAALFDELARLESSEVAIGSEYWQGERGSSEEFAQVRVSLATVVPTLAQETEWVLDCLEAGRTGSGTKKEARDGWLSLVAMIRECAEKIPPLDELVQAEGPQAPTDLAPEHAIALCDEIIAQLRAGEKLGGPTPELRPEWTEFVERVTVDAGAPRTVAHYQALRNLFEIRALRDELRRRWDRQLGPHGGASSGSLGERPEVRGHEQIERIESALAWWNAVWQPLERSLAELGFDWARFRRDHPSEPRVFGELHAMHSWAESVLPEILEHRAERLSLSSRHGERDRWIEAISDFPRSGVLGSLVKLFEQGLKKKDFDAYTLAWRRLHEVIERRPLIARRAELLGRLAESAMGLAEAIESRDEAHCAGSPPGEFRAAWKHRQWERALAERHDVDFHGLQTRLADVQTRLHEATATYVEKLAWAAQAERTGLAQQQALAGWLALQKKIGRGTGKGVAKLREEAQKVLAECRSAVPVWIMPLSRVMESFDLATTRFDVVILDEASQNDVVGLVALALGREAVVVGDHEQVSPYAVGYDADRIQSLIDEILVDIPNQQLYDGRTSVYDLARQSFGGTIRLLEHFRCVPDIIQFSNFLCYGGEIRPLRERSASLLLPHVVAHTVEGGVAKEKVNKVEATEVASLIAALCREPEYDGATIGVISMVGTEQALAIDAILRARLPVAEIERRRLLSGNASQFQGDERDVMFLSLVDSPKERPLTLRRREDARKVFNVAASRARDQLWVVHSLDPARDLKAGDLRLQLISHAVDPGSSLEDAKQTAASRRPVTAFEQALHDELTVAGYRTTLHFPVGAMPIDLVVEGSAGQRVAILCEGGEGDPPEDLAQRLEPPMVLSRLGWTVIRIRASVFTLDRKAALRKLVRRLKAAEIEPIGESDATPNVTPESSELRDRVVASAAKIRKEWSRSGGGAPLRRSKGGRK